MHHATEFIVTVIKNGAIHSDSSIRNNGIELAKSCHCGVNKLLIVFHRADVHGNGNRVVCTQLLNNLREPITITSTECNLGSQVNELFGRCSANS